METQELKTFLSVARNQSFSLAAKELFVTQPAVSKRIASLEESLKAPLFDRIGHKVSLTEYGETLLPRAEHILLEIEDIQRSIKNISGEVGGKLSLGASHHVGLHRLPPYLKGYSQKYPSVNLDIRFVDSEQAHDAVLKGEIEIAAVTLPEDVKPQLKSIEIWVDELNVVVSKEHDLATESKVDLKTLSNYQAILPSPATFTHGFITQAFSQKNISIDTAISTNYIETIKMLVNTGLGWSALPESMIHKDLENRELIKLEVDGFPIKRSLGCVYHSDRTLSNAAKALLKLFQEE